MKAVAAYPAGQGLHRQQPYDGAEISRRSDFTWESFRRLRCQASLAPSLLPVPILESSAMLCDGHQNCVNSLIYTDSPI